MNLEHLETELAEPTLEKLTYRTPAEILAMQFDDGDRILGERILSEGETLSVLGVGGLGKSRITLQMAAAQIMGRPFLNLQTHGKPRKWLIIQTENSNRRLQDDFIRLQQWCGKDWPLVEANLVIHTIEKEEDSLLQIEDLEAIARLEKLIAEVSPDVVVWDPLKDTTWDDLNTDKVMANLLRTLCRLSRKLNPKRAVVIVHHALTGKSGAAKASGMDRASFGRNSKVLHSFCRAAINIVPAEEDDNGKLIFFCGKNNNGPEFKPFAADLGEDFIYRVDARFDMDEWKEEMGIASKTGGQSKDSAALQILRDQPMDLASWVKAIDAKGVWSRSKAYENAERLAKPKANLVAIHKGIYHAK
ncbi:MAG: AAA family ATPase [Methylacidiphilales bacterium]|nr:AAA family ATPase [Candidatus Methylacidiphilales bacterium]